MRFARDTTGQRGSAFTTSAKSVGSFSTAFTFRLTNPGGITDGFGQTGADGFTFTIQAIGPGALGGGGGGLGYQSLSPSVAVEWDTWANAFENSNHIGVNVNGSLTSLQTSSVGTQFDNGLLWHGWIDYDGTTLEVRTNMTGMRPVAPDLSRVINIPGILGTSSAFVGFTGATGGAFANHDIVSWSFAPEPTTFALFGIGLLGLAARARRRRG